MEMARRQEGGEPTIGATRQIGALKVDTNEFSIAIDASKLDAPSQVYDADFAWIEYRTGRLSLFFGKYDDDPEMLRTRLEVRYPPERFISTFWNLSKSFIEKMQTYVETWPKDARAGETPPTNLHAKDSHSEWASFTYMSHSGSQASLDFYHVNPSGIARLLQTKSTEGLRLLSVVRVQLSTFDLFRLTEQARGVVDAIKETLPDVHRKVEMSDEE
jgi:hypothetical protein